MDEIVRRAMRSALVLAAVCLLLWALFEEGKTVAAGLILGLGAGMLNTMLLQRRVQHLGQVMEKERPRKFGLGMGARLAVVAVVAMIALKFPDRFNLPSALIASFYLPFAVLISALLHNLRQSNGKG